MKKHIKSILTAAIMLTISGGGGKCFSGNCPGIR